VKNRWHQAATLAATIGILSVVIFTFFPIQEVLAATLQNSQFAQLGANSGLATASLPIVIARIIRIILGIIGLILTLLVIYAGYLYLTAHGEEEPVKKAKKILQNAMIGLVIIFSSFALTTFILNSLLNAAGYGSGGSSSSANYTEPLSGSLGSGFIDSHYPDRNALNIPRNTNIMIRFKEPVAYDSIITGYAAAAAAGATTFDLNTSNIKIYPSELTGAAIDTGKLASDKVGVTFVRPAAGVAGPTTFTFNPDELLGSSASNTNYTVLITPGVLKADGSRAFSGAYASGYSWTFEISTEVDMTPPTVVSVNPIRVPGSSVARNTIIQINFSEAMDPVAASGIFASNSADGNFTNIKVLSGVSGSQASETGSFTISNGYRTVEFVTDDVCGQDPCGNLVYCLPSSSRIEVQAQAASISTATPPSPELPQADTSLTNGVIDGLVDACSNSLDGDGDWGETGGEAGDDYVWNFDTSDAIDNRVPAITALVPSLTANEEIDVNQPVQITFNMVMQIGTLNNTNIKLIPNPDTANVGFSELSYWLTGQNSTGALAVTTAIINHATLWESEGTVDENNNGVIDRYDYFPIITKGVKGQNQFCMYPSAGPKSGTETNTSCVSAAEPYCCYGQSSSTPCVTPSEGTNLF